MANHKSAEKRARQTIKRTERNRFYRTRLKNLTKAVRVAVANGDKDAALLALKDVNKNFHSFVSKGFLKKETASRKVGRLAKLVSTLAA
ncbi:30S ribosomal protein S20 [Campylobacter hyointestinalis]|uniref:30S ribosomal protein S20 n=1 Tax=Campylobacter hyointestinalis TaxID=198 RepID=UPI00072B141B|nr:30S ribosomal protein S20 [Campylobacter hyointestinalis]PPB68509.1 30S ribosomal protein S20 [Campylobacter hyointestinalis subsp. hyointestinalis]CUU77785.1 30S ribosomal protein S20 [Campylobacter hyointestinalis subsp. hyointestinalis]